MLTFSEILPTATVAAAERLASRGAWRHGETEGRMRRPISIAITVVLSVFALMFWQIRVDAKAEDTPTAALALACEGTADDKINLDAKSKPISMGIIVNLTARTVTGFTGANFPVAITRIDDKRILFRGLNFNPASFSAVYGSIDRVTWAVEATTDGLPTLNSLTRYSLKCDEV